MFDIVLFLLSPKLSVIFRFSGLALFCSFSFIYKFKCFWLDLFGVSRCFLNSRELKIPPNFWFVVWSFFIMTWLFHFFSTYEFEYLFKYCFFSSCNYYNQNYCISGDPDISQSLYNGISWYPARSPSFHSFWFNFDPLWFIDILKLDFRGPEIFQTLLIQ